MTADLVIYGYRFPVNRGNTSIVSAPSPDRLKMLPTIRPDMGPGEGSGWIVIERSTGLYGPDAEIISALSPGSIIDVYA